MPGGRPTGSRNVRGHGAGGSRPGAGRKSREEKAQLEEENQAKRRRVEEQRLVTKARAAADRETMLQQRQERIDQAEKSALEALQKTAFSQRIRDDQTREEIEVVTVDKDDNCEGLPSANNPAEDDMPEPADEADEIDDYLNEDEGDGPTKARRARIRAAYMPPKDSVVGRVLAETQKKVEGSANRLQMSIDVNRMWIPPGPDPYTFSVISGPDKFYEAEVWQFLWLPFKQFRARVQLNQVGCCFGCSGCGKAKLNGMRWRPMKKHDKTVFVLHHRVLFECCNRSTTTISLAFLAKLPTPIAERFPFITTAAGPGVHRSMVYQLNSLKTKQIMEGTYSSTINAASKIRYDLSRLSYYDRIGDDMLQKEMAGNIGESPIPQPYSQYNCPDEFNGFTLTPNMMSAASQSYFDANEEYMQASFQTKGDGGVFSDHTHTHKYPNGIRASGRPGKVFGAAYTMGALIGFINLLVLTFTKSISELLPLIILYKKSRRTLMLGHFAGTNQTTSLATMASLLTPLPSGMNLKQMWFLTVRQTQIAPELL